MLLSRSPANGPANRPYASVEEGLFSPAIAWARPKPVIGRLLISKRRHSGPERKREGAGGKHFQLPFFPQVEALSPCSVPLAGLQRLGPRLSSCPLTMAITCIECARPDARPLHRSGSLRAISLDSTNWICLGLWPHTTVSGRVSRDASGPTCNHLEPASWRPLRHSSNASHRENHREQADGLRRPKPLEHRRRI